MFATIVSVIMVLVFGVGAHLVPGFEGMFDIPKSYFDFFFKATFFLSLMPWLTMLFLSQGAETQPITMAALRSNLADWKMYAYSAGIAALSLLGMLGVFQSQFPPIWSFAGSALCAGVLLDLLRMSYCRLQYRRTPEGLAEWFKEVMLESAKKGDETWYIISFEVPLALMVVYMRCGAYGSLNLFCGKIAEMSGLWLGSIAQLLMVRLPGGSEEALLDRYARAEAMAAKRVSWVLQEACDMGSTAGVGETMRLIGKLFLTFHGRHKSLGGLLLQILEQTPQRSPVKIGLRELDLEVVSTFVDVIASLIDRSVRQNRADRSAILKVLEICEKRLDGVFRRDKSADFPFLVRPLAQIEHMLSSEPYRSCLAREEILSELRRILNRFSS